MYLRFKVIGFLFWLVLDQKGFDSATKAIGISMLTVVIRVGGTLSNQNSVDILFRSLMSERYTGQSNILSQLFV